MSGVFHGGGVKAPEFWRPMVVTQRRTLSILKYVSAGFCMGVLGAFVFSGWYEVYRTQPTWCVGMGYGRIKCVLDPGAREEPHWRVSRIENPPCWLWGGVIAYPQAAIIPLWVVWITALLPTAVLWWLNRSRHREGCCQCCGYNLTGNVSGRCPECGRPTKARGLPPSAPD